MRPRMDAGHRRFRVTEPRHPTYIVVLCVHWPALIQMQDQVAREIGLSRRERYFPHVTLCGPFSLAPGVDPVFLLDRALRPLSTPGVVHPGDLHVFEGDRGLAVSFLLREDRELAACAQAVNRAISPYFRTCNRIDIPPSQRILHVSVAVNLPKEKGQQVLSLAKDIGCGIDPGDGVSPGDRLPRALRLAVIRRGALWKAYDFYRKSWVGRSGMFKAGGPTQQ